MTHPLRRLGKPALVGLSQALTNGRLTPPFPRHALVTQVPEGEVDLVRAALVEMSADGMAPRHIGLALSLLAEERASAQRMADRVDLVWSPPDLDGVDARDTSVVVQDLFRLAERTVLITTFALDEGKKAGALFGALAARMDARPELDVRVVANIHRAYRDETPSPVLIREFSSRVRGQVWPGSRLPSVFYDPRSLEIDAPKRAVLHAKCVVVDCRWSLLTSANFTEAAQERNIEAGVLVEDRRFAERVVRQFDALIETGHLRQLL